MKRYSAYKPSGVEWIGDIPEKWSIKKIKHLFNVYAGATPETKNKNYWDGDIVWITPADYKTVDKIILGGSRNITKEGLNSCNTQIVPKGSLIFSKRAPIGTVAISGVELCTNQGCLSCVSKCVNTTFFYYAISVFTEIFDMLGSGATFKEISADSFVNVKLPVPSSLEQEIIVSYLDAKCAKIDNVLSVQQKRIELLKELKQSIITNAVTKGLDKNVEFKSSGIEWIGDIPEKWEVGKIKFYSTLHNGDRSSEYPNAKELVDEGVLFLTSNNIHNLILDVSNVQNKYITDEKYKRLGGAKICLNDIVFCLRGSIGNCSINTSISKGTVASSLVVIRPNRINAFFLNYALHSNIVESQTCIAMNGSCAANLSAENVGNYYIAIPPKDVQEHITFYLDKKCSAIDNQISKIERQIELLKEYKQSIITECVTGKRKVC